MPMEYSLSAPASCAPSTRRCWWMIAKSSSSVSVGASVFPDHERDAEALLRAADAALFRAKALGRSQLAQFTPELLVTASAKFSIEQSLRRAIQNDEFELFYQPLINTETLDVALVEALIRWRMPDGSYRSPDEFLAVAEESGLIVEISDWVLRTAICTAARWHRGAWPERARRDQRLAAAVPRLSFREQAGGAAARVRSACALPRARAHRVRAADRCAHHQDTGPVALDRRGHRAG